MNAETADSTQITMGKLAGSYFERYVLVTTIVPLMFILITIGKVALFPSGFIRNAMSSVGYVWPVFEAQYWEVGRVAGIHFADNYLAFASVMLITYIVFVIYAATAVSRGYFAVAPLRISELGAILLCLIGGVYAAFFDAPKSDPRPFYNFYVDSFGLFYVRQWILLLAGGLAPYLMVFFVAKLSGKALARTQ